MRPPKQKQPQVKKGLCRVLEQVDVDVDVLPVRFVKIKGLELSAFWCSRLLF